MSGRFHSVRIKIRRWPIVLWASGVTAVWLSMLWLIHVYIPSDQGGLTRLMRPLLPYITVGVLVEAGRYFRGVIVGTIEVNEAGFILPWFWRSSRRLTRWASVAVAEVDTVAGFGIRTARLRLVGTDGSVLAFVAKRWVQQWDVMVDAVANRTGQLRNTPPVGVWDDMAANGLVRPRPRWLSRLQRSRTRATGPDSKESDG